MNADEMKKRTKQYALRIIRLVQSLPPGRMSDIIGGQPVRAGTSVGSNYRAACRVRSRADLINKLGIVEEEADESLFYPQSAIRNPKLR